MSKLKRNARLSGSKSAAPKGAKPARKDKQLIKQIVKAVIVNGAVVAGLFTGMTYVLSMQGGAEKEQKKIEGELRGIQSKTSALSNQIESLGAAAQIYADLVQSRSNMSFVVDPLAIRPILAELKAKHHITRLNVEFASRQPLSIKNLKADDLEPVRFEAAINMASMSDHFIYQFLEELSRRVPGFVYINDIEMTRIQPMSIEVLSKISRGIKVETTQANLQLYWYGFAHKQASGDGA